MIVIPKTEQHEGMIVTDSFIVFIVLTLIKKWRKNKQCKTSSKPSASQQVLYWESASKENQTHNGFYT